MIHLSPLGKCDLTFDLHWFVGIRLSSIINNDTITEIAPPDLLSHSRESFSIRFKKA